MLPRVRAGLLAQTRKDFEWVILNDGGEKDGPTKEAEAAREAGLNVSLYHNDQGVGRSEAANQVVRHSSGAYVLLHDDDDALEPAFLEKTAGHLDANADHIGCVTRIQRIEERLNEHGAYTEIARRLLDEIPANLYLADMIQRNRFAPIGFLYRRTAFDAVRGYDPDFDVLEDWDFNLRMLMHGDIGVIQEPLALYFIRTEIADGQHRLANTVHARENDHWRDHAALHNRLLRKDLAAGQFGLGSLMALSRYVEPAHQTNASLERMKSALERVGLRSLWRRANR